MFLIQIIPTHKVFLVGFSITAVMCSFTMWQRCDRSAMLFLISLVDKVLDGMSGVCSGVVGSDRFIYVVGSAVKKHAASLAADIRVSSSLSIALSGICLSASVYSSLYLYAQRGF